MIAPARHLRLLGKAEHRGEAEGLIAGLGEAVIVERGRPRSIVMRCPDGCGQVLVVNLDGRAGKAWELDLRKEGPTLYPSVWREGGCGSHFLVWRGRILWCDRFMEGNSEPEPDPQLEMRVHAKLDPTISRSAFDLAAELDELVWDVDRALKALARKGFAVDFKGASGWTYRAKL